MKISCCTFLQEHFPSITLEKLAILIAHELESKFDTKTYFLLKGAAILVVPTNKAVSYGGNPENLEDVKNQTVVFNFIHQYTDTTKPLLRRFDDMTFWVPYSPYSTYLSLAPGELDRKFIQLQGHNKKNEEKTFECFLIWKKRLSPVAILNIENLVNVWALESAKAPGFANEYFEKIPEALWTESEPGIRLEITSQKGLTFPWVELYLRLRANLACNNWPNYMSFKRIKNQDNPIG